MHHQKTEYVVNYFQSSSRERERDYTYILVYYKNEHDFITIDASEWCWIYNER